MIITLILLSLTCCVGRESEQVYTHNSHDTDTVADTSHVEPKKDVIGDDEDPYTFIINSENYDKYRSGILPLMASENPKYCRRLLRNEYEGFIVVDKRTMKVLLYDKYGRERRAYKMACARNFGTKHKKGDSRTPEGFFSVENIYDSSDWVFVDDNGKKSTRKGEYGPRFIRLAIPVTWNIGIHGTCAPWSLGGRVSHGCIRISNEDIMELVGLVTPGMPVIISPGLRDRLANEKEGYDIAAVTTEPYDHSALERMREREDAKLNEAEESADSTIYNQSEQIIPIPTDSI